MIYIIGSLRNPQVPLIANELRRALPGQEIFDSWYAAGPEADDKWQAYEKARGHSYADALAGYAAQNVFAFDKRHLDRAHSVVLVLPAGKSGHLELGYSLGRGKRGYILLEADEPERFDVMYNFATGVVRTTAELVERILNDTSAPSTRRD